MEENTPKKNILLRLIRNKFVIATFIFLVWVAFLDKNSFRSRLNFQKETRELKKEKDYYLDKMKTDSIQIQELKSNKDNLEKFAREQYYMKKPEEDVFIIVEEEE